MEGSAIQGSFKMPSPAFEALSLGVVFRVVLDEVSCLKALKLPLKPKP